MKITWPQFERFWYLLSIGVIIAAMPFSKFLISMGQFMLIGGWIVGRFDYHRWTEKISPLPFRNQILRILPLSLSLLIKGIAGGFRDFFRHRAALIFSSILLMHLAGLLFTTDFQYAFKDLRTKLPLLIIPLVFATTPSIRPMMFRRYLFLLILALLVRTIFNTWAIETRDFVDLREVSRNVSHIILSLLLSLGIFVCGFFLFEKDNKKILFRAGCFLVITWFIIYLILSASFTGLIISLTLLIFLIPLLIMKAARKSVRLTVAAAAVLLVILPAWYLREIIKDHYQIQPVDLSALEMFTSRGNPYIHNYEATGTENGHLLWVYVQWDEMREEWNRRSTIPFDSLDRSNHTLAYTTVHFLTSKGWRKDGDAIGQLSDREISAIEKGISNHLFIDGPGIRGRIYEFLKGYDIYRETGNPTGSTIMQRFEFWRASAGIIRDHWLTGVGTGDMNIAFEQQYKTMNTLLEPGQRWRSHNQFLSVMVGFGVFGLIWFLAAIWLPPYIMHKQYDFFVITHLMISMLAMLAEDTIESQTGITFFVLFYSLFLFARFSRPEKTGTITKTDTP